MRCLLVDDEPGIREGLAMLLRLRGHEVHTAAAVASGLAALHEREFDVVITDWRLPDGDGSAILAASPCPVFAVSGHPEEVRHQGRLRQVLTKPLSPTRLLQLLQELGAEPTAGPASPAADVLPRDVAEVIARLRTAIAVAVAVDDDGTFVTVRGRLPATTPLATLAAAGGDLRHRRDGADHHFELRLCRDGRPDPAMVVVAATAPWPELPEFAVDFHDSGADDDEPARWLDRSAACRATGRRVHFLNTPPAFARWAALHGRSHDMPKREPIGPRLPADLADLWR